MITEVKAVEDYDGYWYIIPPEKYEQFNKDIEFLDDDDLHAVWGFYKLAGDLNSIQLYAQI